MEIPKVAKLLHNHNAEQNMIILKETQEIYLLAKLFFGHFIKSLRLKNINAGKSYVYSEIVKIIEDPQADFSSNKFKKINYFKSKKSLISKITKNILIILLMQIHQKRVQIKLARHLAILVMYSQMENFSLLIFKEIVTILLIHLLIPKSKGIQI